MNVVQCFAYFLQDFCGCEVRNLKSLTFWGGGRGMGHMLRTLSWPPCPCLQASLGGTCPPAVPGFQIGVSLALFFQSLLLITSTNCFLMLSSIPDTLLLRSFEWHPPGRKLYGAKGQLPWEHVVGVGRGGHSTDHWKVKEIRARKVAGLTMWGSFARKGK